MLGVYKASLTRVEKEPDSKSLLLNTKLVVLLIKTLEIGLEANAIGTAGLLLVKRPDWTIKDKDKYGPNRNKNNTDTLDENNIEAIQGKQRNIKEIKRKASKLIWWTFVMEIVFETTRKLEITIRVNPIIQIVVRTLVKRIRELKNKSCIAKLEAIDSRGIIWRE